MSFAHALDPMYDYRYTFGPEILVPDAFHVGFGGWTHRNEDGSLAANIQIGLADAFEIGAKYIHGTDQRWIIAKDKRYRNHNLSFLDVGAKYAISPHLALQADVPMAINKDREWGGIISLTQLDGYTKNVSFLFEGRLGLGGAAGHDKYVKPSLAFFPYFQIGNAFRISVGTIGSCNIGDPDYFDDFMVDILPRVEVGLIWFRLMGEASIEILTKESDKYTRFAVFIVADV
jgi:hypothetical protein